MDSCFSWEPSPAQPPPQPFIYNPFLAASVPDEAMPPADHPPQPETPEKPMGLLQRFGSRNHPETKARKVRAQKARAGMAVTEETVAKYTAARGFLYGEWFGASLMAASIALVYLLAGCPKGAAASCTTGSGVSPTWAIGSSLVVFALGAWVFLSNHRYYKRLDFPWAKRWDTAAIVLGGSGAIFWLLFGLLVFLARLGVRVSP